MYDSLNRMLIGYMVLWKSGRKANLNTISRFKVIRIQTNHALSESLSKSTDFVQPYPLSKIMENEKARY